VNVFQPSTRRFDGRKDRRHMSSEYELTFTVKGVGGIQRTRVDSPSEQTARDLVRAQYGTREVQIVSGRQTRFGDRRDDVRGGGGR
jgi:hypothetical protein